MPLAPGTKFGVYEVVALLGVGGMGEVYKARDTRLGRSVAIKILPPDKVRDPERKRRFIQEAQAASALNHPNIVTIYDIGSEDGADFIVMEFIDGKPLGDLIPRSGMRLSEALNVAIAVADALAKAHGSGIVHRDLKPANVMVSNDGVVKLLDFGLAKLMEKAPVGDVTLTMRDAPLTEEGTVLGTVAYMSPEQAEAKDVDSRSDVFAFGSVLYEMLTGRRAFSADSRMATMAAILHNDPTPIGQIVPSVPRELERMVMRCLRKEPGKRWQSMADLRTSLQEVKEDSDSGQIRSGALSSAPAPPTAKKLLWPAVAAVVMTAGAAWWFTHGNPAATPDSDLLRPVPLTAYPGTEESPSLSPDGSQVAFSWDGEKEDNVDIYVKRIGPGPPLRLTTNEMEDRKPAWSPDGSAIAFIRISKAGQSSILLVPPLGGPERVLNDGDRIRNDIVQNLVWSPDGKWLLAGLKEGMAAISLESGEVRKLGESVDVPAAFGPEGRSLLLVRTFASNSRDLYLLPLTTDLHPAGEARAVTKVRGDMRGAAWISESDVVFSSGRPGDNPLWRVAAAGGTARRITGPIEVAGLSFAPSQRRLVFEQRTREFDIYGVDLTAGGASAQNPRPIIASTRFDRNPAFSPDGSKIAFASLSSGTWQLSVSDSDGRNAIQLTSFEDAEIAWPEWSPNGKNICFVANTGEREAYVVPATGGKPRKLEQLGKDVNRVECRDDGQGAVVQTPGPYGRSIDGDQYFYLAGDAVRERAPDGTGDREITKIGAKFYDRNVNPLVATKAGLYFLANSTPSRPGELMFYKFPSGPWVKVQGVDGISQYGISVSPDGKLMLYTKMVSHGSDLMLVDKLK